MPARGTDRAVPDERTVFERFAQALHTDLVVLPEEVALVCETRVGSLVLQDLKLIDMSTHS